TGEVLGLSRSYGYAFFKAQEATKTPLPVEGTVLITVADKDKKEAIQTATLFKELGFTILTTKGTGKYLKENGIPTQSIEKLGFGRPDIVDALKNKEIDVVINTPSGKESKIDDSYIRKTAIKYNIPYITTIAASIAAATGIEAKRRNKVDIRSLQEYHQDIK
ncbi:MAG: carbamoyl phosphate synthase large subunit, partial [Desulfobacterium sp.]|nr:carbamoyl phosphate synthase large subunit [Desulfobacterium sp.]